MSAFGARADVPFTDTDRPVFRLADITGRVDPNDAFSPIGIAQSRRSLRLTGIEPENDTAQLVELLETGTFNELLAQFPAPHGECTVGITQVIILRHDGRRLIGNSARSGCHGAELVKDREVLWDAGGVQGVVIALTDWAQYWGEAEGL